MTELELAILRHVAEGHRAIDSRPKYWETGINREVWGAWNYDRAVGVEFRPNRWFCDDSDAARKRHSRAAAKLIAAGLLVSGKDTSRLSRVKLTSKGWQALLELAGTVNGHAEATP